MASSGPLSPAMVAEAVTGAARAAPVAVTVLVMVPSWVGEAYSLTVAS